MNNFYKIILFLFALCFSSAIAAANNYDREIEKFYLDNPNYNNLSKEQKIIKASELFLGKPYQLGALGEGEDGEFDQNPLYRTDSFDCMTFTSTVLALGNSSNLKEFQYHIKSINYLNGEVSYFNRYHFTNIDWNKHNQTNNFLEDYTPEIVDKYGKPIALTAQTIIDKPSWYAMKSMDNIKIKTSLSIDKKQKLLEKMHSLAANTNQETSVMYYLPLNQLFSADHSPNYYFFNQIPTPSIIEIVTPDNESYKNTLGTALDVSHLGLALKIHDKLIFREASSSKKFGMGVIDVPLATYLQNYINSKTIKGINIEKIL